MMTNRKEERPWGSIPCPPSPPPPTSRKSLLYTEGEGSPPTAILNFTEKQNCKDHQNVNIFDIFFIKMSTSIAVWRPFCFSLGSSLGRDTGLGLAQASPPSPGLLPAASQAKQGARSLPTPLPPFHKDSIWQSRCKSLPAHSPLTVTAGAASALFPDK